MVQLGHTFRRTDQWNRGENQEIVSIMYTHVVYTKSSILNNCENTDPLRWFGITRYLYTTIQNYIETILLT